MCAHIPLTSGLVSPSGDRAMFEMSPSDPSGLPSSPSLKALPAVTGAPTSHLAESDKVIALFSEKQLLARAMETDVTRDLDKDRPRPDYRTFTSEMDLMHTTEKMSNVSCTLLVPDSPVATYKPYGFLFNAKTSKIVHAATHDVISVVRSDETLDVPEEENLTIEELAKAIESKLAFEKSSMNEVNATFGVGDLVGLFVVDSDDKMNQIDVILVQDMLKQKYRLNVPIYSYNQQRGQITLYDKKAKAISLIVEAKNRKGIPFARIIAPSLGLSVSESGRVRPSS